MVDSSRISYLLIIVVAVVISTTNHVWAQQGIIVWTADGLTRVQPDDSPRPNKEIVIKAARNEYEPFQVIVTAGSQGLKDVNASVSDLSDGKGHTIKADSANPKGNIKLYREHYIEIKRPSPRCPTPPGWWPDALIPFFSPIDGSDLKGARFDASPFDVPPGKNQPIWVDVFIPKDTVPGDYEGNVTITAENQKSVSIPIKLRVWSFTLPDRPTMRSDFGSFGGRIAVPHKVKVGSPEYRSLERRYCEEMAAHRLCPQIPGHLLPKINPDGSIDPSKTHAALKEFIESMHINSLRLRIIGRKPLSAGRERAKKYLTSIYAYLKENGWDKMAYVYALDEPNDAKAYQAVRDRAKLIHEANPDIKVLITEQTTPSNPAWGSLVGAVDIWVPLWPLHDEKTAAERLAAGDELWSYTALCQGREPTPFWQLDFPILNYRIPCWISWSQHMTGLLYWTTVFWKQTPDPWTNPLTYRERYNAEGMLFYPGIDAGFAGPVASMRLKAIREGMEDYEYFKILSDLGGKSFVNEQVRAIGAHWTEWDKDSKHLYEAREKIAERIERISKKLQQ